MKLWLVSVKQWDVMDHAVVRAESAEQAVLLASKRLPHQVEELEAIELPCEGRREVVHYSFMRYNK